MTANDLAQLIRQAHDFRDLQQRVEAALEKERVDREDRERFERETFDNDYDLHQD